MRAKAAEDAGVDSLWVAEAWGRDAFSLLTQVAERTSRIQLGTGIVNIYSRTPAALAQHFATLDELSGGRVIIGLGNSGPNVIEHFHGIPFQPALRRMRETVELLRLFFKHEPVKYAGEIFKLERGFTLRFDPVRKEVPIYLATLNPKSVKMTAELADGWMPVMIPIDQLATEVARVQPVGPRSRARPEEVHGARARRGDRREHARAAAARTAPLGGNARVLLRAHGRVLLPPALAPGLPGRGRPRARCVGRGRSREGRRRRAAGDDGAARLRRALQSNVYERLEQEEAAGATLHSATVLEEDPREAAKILAKLVG